jgi:predicted RNA-binding protein with PUA-like domain
MLEHTTACGTTIIFYQITCKWLGCTQNGRFAAVLCAKIKQMNYWVMKSEPAEFSIDDLAHVGEEPWDGVRNYQVRNMFRDQFTPGDRALFYHSNTAEIGVVGEMEVVSNAYPDPTQFDAENPHFDPKSSADNPRWLLVDVKFIRKFSRVVTLDEMKQAPALASVPLVKQGNRLSVVPLQKEEYAHILALAETNQR